MENHPIPQDVTGFQFKLIGDMTVKQFAFLAAGFVLAWLFYSIHVSWLIRFPLAGLCAGLGAALAFLPVEGRPLDVMVINFIKALFAPNQYIFRKTGGQFTHLSLQPVLAKTSVSQPHTPSVQSQEKLSAYLQNLHAASRSPLDQKESSLLTSVSSLFSGNYTPPSPTLAKAPTHMVSMLSDAPIQAPQPIKEPPSTEQPEQKKTRCMTYIEE